MKRSDAGSGGRKGHSNMEHWSPTAWVKADARTARRANDRLAVAEQLGAGRFCGDPDAPLVYALTGELIEAADLEAEADALLAEADVAAAHRCALDELEAIEHDRFFEGVDLPTWGDVLDPEELRWGFTITTRP